MTLSQLRRQHSRFCYQSFSAKVVPAGLRLTHFFTIEPNIEFAPTVIIEGVTEKQWIAIPADLRQAWVFHLGLAEILSYWKATAAPEIVIKAGHLTNSQVAWWHNLLLKGMGEYFYVNDIDFTQENFVSWKNEVSNQNRSNQAETAAYKPQSQEEAITTGSQVGVQNEGNAIVNFNAGSTESRQNTKAKHLLPLGGGKDSATTACLLNQHNTPFDIFLLNPTPAMKQVANIVHPQAKPPQASPSQAKPPQANPPLIITAQRTIDPKLLALNNQGYLNGHVPFSAYLAWLSGLVKTIFGHHSVVVANERSSNQGNVEFHGHEINHQYSKSAEFEHNFEQYLHNYHLVPKKTRIKGIKPQGKPWILSEASLGVLNPRGINTNDNVQANISHNAQTNTRNQEPSYFSLLRPLYELQISRLFTQCPEFNQLATVFRSCNRGQKTNSWCGQCPKCLFTFISLFPFVPEDKMVEIFGHNLFDDESLLDTALALVGQAKTKPFECVGTYEESKIGFYLSRQKYLDQDKKVPVLLQKIWNQVLAAEKNLTERAEALIFV